MKLSEMKKCHINYRKYEKIVKAFPEGIVVDGLNLIEIIEKQHLLLHEFRNMATFNKLNPKCTSVRSTELWEVIRSTFGDETIELKPVKVLK